MYTPRRVFHRHEPVGDIREVGLGALALSRHEARRNLVHSAQVDVQAHFLLHVVGDPSLDKQRHRRKWVGVHHVLLYGDGEIKHRHPRLHLDAPIESESGIALFS